jgi:hypothetical protein
LRFRKKTMCVFQLNIIKKAVFAICYFDLLNSDIPSGREKRTSFF